MKKLFYSVYSFVCYVIFLATFLYMIGFVENLTRYSFAQPVAQFFPKTVDTGVSILSGLPAILVNLLLISLFGMQHSVMARPGFKEKWTKIVAEPIERSTYVLLASLMLILLFYFWQPVGLVIWDLSGSIVGNVFFALSIIGWLLLLLSTYMINHFQLFGLRQVYLFVRGKEPQRMIKFQKPGFYKVIRHPIYFSFLVIFWFAPLMTLAHLVFSCGMTTYIFIGIYHEESDLIKVFKEQYLSYRREVPKIIPFTKSAKKSPSYNPDVD